MSRKKLYLVLDCETATLPCASRIAKNENEKKNIAIAKPLIYDIGWTIVDRNGTLYDKKEFLVSEIFSVPQIFNTGYYHDKKPIYLKKLKEKKTQLLNWDNIAEILIEDMDKVSVVCAFNSMFDFKKAIPFTEKYIRNLYSEHFYKWEQKQEQICKKIAIGKNKKTESTDFDKDHFVFRDIEYPLSDLWGVACQKLINTKTYKKMCLEQGMVSSSGEFFKTSAESTFRYIIKDCSFDEDHTALEDAIIETEILVKALKKGKLPIGIIYFPFKELGKTTEFIADNADKLKAKHIKPTIEIMETRIKQGGYPPYVKRLEKTKNTLIEILEEIK